MTDQTPRPTWQDWQARRDAIAFDGRSLLGGARVDPLSDGTLERRSPADGRLLHQIPIGAEADAAHAVSIARAAFEEGPWRQFSPMIRKVMLMGFAGAVEAHGPELALLDSLEMGKPITQALGDATACAHILRYYAEYADKAHGDSASTAPSTIQYNRREPRGVVAAMVSWNYPLPNAALKIGPALAAGNSLILKPSELSPSSALRLAEIALECGIPPGVFNVLVGAGATVGAALARHPDVDLIAFTGSTATGRELVRQSADGGVKALQLECGGKSANIVLPDFADLAAVARDTAQRIFENQGQLCVAGARLIVHASRKDELVAAVVAQAQALRIGDPLDPETTFGPLASQERCGAVLTACEAARAAGAVLRHGGTTADGHPDGAYMAPTIFDNVTGDMPLAQADIFGPVLSVLTFETPEEALALANGTPYGLSASVWTRDLTVAGRMIDGLKAGRVTVLAAPPHPMAFAAPLGAEPFGQSGVGAEGGRQGYETFTRLKAVDIHH